MRTPGNPANSPSAKRRYADTSRDLCPDGSPIRWAMAAANMGCITPPPRVQVLMGGGTCKNYKARTHLRPRISKGDGELGVGRGEEVFCCKAFLYSPRRATSDLQGFPHKFVSLIFIVLRSYVMLNTKARAKRARPNVVIASEMLIGTEMLENNTRGK